MTEAVQSAPVEQETNGHSRDIPLYQIPPEPTEHPEGDAIRRQVSYAILSLCHSQADVR
jgi:hypothetical protein